MQYGVNPFEENVRVLGYIFEWTADIYWMNGWLIEVIDWTADL